MLKYKITKRTEIFIDEDVLPKLKGMKCEVTCGVVLNRTSGKLLHRELFNIKKGEWAAFKDGNRFNLTKANIQIFKRGATPRKINTQYAVEGDIVRCVTRHGYHFTFDLIEMPVVGNYNWCHSGGYVMRRANKKLILLHREITRAKPGEVVDHINHDVSNNTRSNLRCCTYSENMTNKKGVIGCFWAKNMSKWCAKINKDKKQVYCEYFWTKEAAQIAYCKKAREVFGEFEPPICK